MKSVLITILMSASLGMVPASSGNHCGPLTSQSQQPASVDTDRIVSALTAKETEFRKALAQYSFKRDALIQTIARGGQVSGESHRTSMITFDETGKPIEKILFFPTPTLSGIGMSAEDLDNLGGVQLSALEASKASLYNFKYAGKERIDELDLHVFDVTPKSSPDPKKKDRFFQGRIWVDMQGYQIVKSRGKGLPEPKYNPYPTVETYREEIDGRYWFPTYVYADEELVLANGQVVKVRMKVTYTDFKKQTIH